MKSESVNLRRKYSAGCLTVAFTRRKRYDYKKNNWLALPFAAGEI